MAKESVTLLTRSDIKVMVRQRKASVSSLDGKQHYFVELAAKPYPSDYKVPKFKRYDGREVNVVRTLYAG